MISQRNRGLNQTLFLCQVLVVLGSFGVAIAVSFGFFTGASALHLEHYPVYAVMLLNGLWIELFNRKDAKAADSVFNGNFLLQHRITMRQTLFIAGALLAYLVATKDAFISRVVLAVFVPLLYGALFWSNRQLPKILARRAFGGLAKSALF